MRYSDIWETCTIVKYDLRHQQKLFCKQIYILWLVYSSKYTSPIFDGLKFYKTPIEKYSKFWFFASTIKPVYTDHTRDPKLVADVDSF